MLSPLVHCTCWSIHMYNTYICLQYTCIYIYMIYGDSRNQLLLKLRVKWNTPAQGCKFRTTNLGHIWLFFLENIWLRVTKHQCSTQVLSPGKYGSLKSDDIYVLCICNIYIYIHILYIYIYFIFWYACFSMLMALSSSFHWVSLLPGGVEKSCRVSDGVLGFQLRSSNEWSKISSSSHDFLWHLQQQ